MTHLAGWVWLLRICITLDISPISTTADLHGMTLVCRGYSILQSGTELTGSLNIIVQTYSDTSDFAHI